MYSINFVWFLNRGAPSFYLLNNNHDLSCHRIMGGHIEPRQVENSIAGLHGRKPSVMG